MLPLLSLENDGRTCSACDRTVWLHLQEETPEEVCRDEHLLLRAVSHGVPSHSPSDLTGPHQHQGKGEAKWTMRHPTA